jgi:hypothetical protein
VKSVSSQFQFVEASELSSQPSSTTTTTSSTSSTSSGQAIDSGAVALAFQMVVFWQTDRNVKLTFLFGRSENMQVRVIEASASLNLHDPNLLGARVAKQLLQGLDAQLRREDALHLTWQQERAARESRRSDDAKLRPQLPLTTDDPDLRMRNMVVNELFNTELDFVDDLNLIFVRYLRPLREQQLLSEDRMRELFGNIEVIYELHLAFLASLQAAVIGGGSSDLLARCFLNLMAGGALAHFTTYAVGLQAADTLLSTNFGGKASSKLTKFMTNPQLLAQCHGLSLSALLVKPIQRICKYTLLLPNIVRHTPTSDAAYVKLQDASSLLADLVQRVNTRKHSAEARDAAQRLVKHVSCDGGSELASEFEAALDSGSAELLFDAVVESLLPTEGEHEPRTKPVHLYVLNTALLVCEPASRHIRAIPMSPRNQSLMKLVAVVTWQSCLVVDVRSVGSHAFVFAVHGDGHVWRMSAATAGLKAQCLEVMQARTNAVQDVDDGVVVTSAASLSVLGDLMPDSDEQFASDLYDVLHAYDDDLSTTEADAAFLLDRPTALLPPPGSRSTVTLSSSTTTATAATAATAAVTMPPTTAPPTVPKSAPPMPLSPPPVRRSPSKPKTAPPTKPLSNATTVVSAPASTAPSVDVTVDVDRSRSNLLSKSSSGRSETSSESRESIAPLSPRGVAAVPPQAVIDAPAAPADEIEEVVVVVANGGDPLPVDDDDDDDEAPPPAPDMLPTDSTTPAATAAIAAEQPTAVAGDDDAAKWRNRWVALRKRTVAVERRHALRVSHLEAQQSQRVLVEVLQERLVASQKREWQLSELVDQLRDDLARLSAPNEATPAPASESDLAAQLATAKSDQRRLEATLAAKAQQFFASFSEMENENARLRRELAQRDQRIASLLLRLGDEEAPQQQ